MNESSWKPLAALATLALVAGLAPRAADAQAYEPPICDATTVRVYDDVPESNPFCPWIEELERRGITGGCDAGGSIYCPRNAVTREQLAMSLVRAAEACPTMDPSDEMIRVGGVCIDKYEASIWDAQVGGSQIVGAISCNANGQDCTGIYARSVAGVMPRDNVTWFQAVAALRNSGKRLPTNMEWQMAALGTPDGSPCRVDQFVPTVTGGSPGCASHAGAMDMVGNVTEWVADWMPPSIGCPGWPAGFGGDGMCLSALEPTDSSGYGPSALLRGGAFGDLALAGPFAVEVNALSNSNTGVGFRGAR